MCSSAYHLASPQFYRDCVAAELANRNRSAEQDLFEISDCAFADIHIASSCLQKALRRGELKFALAAARFLLRLDPERLWRRLCVCAFEEFGLVDLRVTARVVAAAASKAFRVVQGEERVLSHLIGLLCDLPKDRRLDDLYGLGTAVLADRSRLRALEQGPLASVVAPLVHQTSRLIATCEQRVSRRAFRVVSNEACERALSRMAEEGPVDVGLFELCGKGVRLSRCLLPVLLPLAIAATEESGGLGEAIQQELLPVPLIGGVPAYAFDGFTRAGRACLARLGSEEPKLQQLLAEMPAARRLDWLSHLLFVAEGSLCTPLIRDHLADTLKSEAIADGMNPDEAGAAVALITDLLPTLHRLRGELVPPVSPEEHLS